ncbi:hypothetical protein D3C87_1674550 [compost metagenome]
MRQRSIKIKNGQHSGFGHCLIGNHIGHKYVLAEIHILLISLPALPLQSLYHADFFLILATLAESDIGFIRLCSKNDLSILSPPRKVIRGNTVSSLVRKNSLNLSYLYDFSTSYFNTRVKFCFCCIKFSTARIDVIATSSAFCVYREDRAGA